MYLFLFSIHFLTPPQDSPVCVTEKVVLVGAAKDENVEIICDINADPPARFVNTCLHICETYDNCHSIDWLQKVSMEI